MSDTFLREFPFPLNDGTMAYLRLPALGLTDDDCARLQEFLWSLVVDKGDAVLRSVEEGKT